MFNDFTWAKIVKTPLQNVATKAELKQENAAGNFQKLFDKVK
jgi:poly(glycerol-phosphate) alpha-glucosyltransferase